MCLILINSNWRFLCNPGERKNRRLQFFWNIKCFHLLCAFKTRPAKLLLLRQKDSKCWQLASWRTLTGRWNGRNFCTTALDFVTWGRDFWNKNGTTHKSQCEMWTTVTLSHAFKWHDQCKLKMLSLSPKLVDKWSLASREWPSASCGRLLVWGRAGRGPGLWQPQKKWQMITAPPLSGSKHLPLGAKSYGS